MTSKEFPNDDDGCWELAGVDPDLLDPVLLTLAGGRAAQKQKCLGGLFPTSFVERGSGHPFVEAFQVDRDSGTAKAGVVVKPEERR